MRFAARAMGWGIAIYAVMYLLWSGLVIYGLAAGIPSLIVRLFALAAITTIAGRAVRMTNWKDLAPYTISWAVAAVIFDAVFLVPFSGWSLYSTWSVWVGYALVAVIPLITSFRRSRSSAVS